MYLPLFFSKRFIKEVLNFLQLSVLFLLHFVFGFINESGTIITKKSFVCISKSYCIYLKFLIYKCRLCTAWVAFCECDISAPYIFQEFSHHKSIITSAIIIFCFSLEKCNLMKSANEFLLVTRTSFRSFSFLKKKVAL